MAQLDAGTRGRISPARVIYVIVGGAKLVRPQLDAIGLPVEVIPAVAMAGPVTPATSQRAGTN